MIGFEVPMYFLFQMTGLDIEKDKIIEMACIVTDSDLNVIAEVGDSFFFFFFLLGIKVPCSQNWAMYRLPANI